MGNFRYPFGENIYILSLGMELKFCPKFEQKKAHQEFSFNWSICRSIIENMLLSYLSYLCGPRVHKWYCTCWGRRRYQGLVDQRRTGTSIQHSTWPWLRWNLQYHNSNHRCSGYIEWPGLDRELFTINLLHLQVNWYCFQLTDFYHCCKKCALQRIN